MLLERRKQRWGKLAFVDGQRNPGLQMRSQKILWRFARTPLIRRTIQRNVSRRQLPQQRRLADLSVAKESDNPPMLESRLDQFSNVAFTNMGHAKFYSQF